MAVLRILSLAARRLYFFLSFFFNDPAPAEIYTLSLHDALPISDMDRPRGPDPRRNRDYFHTDAARPADGRRTARTQQRSEEHTSELQSHVNIVCRLLLEKKKNLIIRGASFLVFSAALAVGAG